MSAERREKLRQAALKRWHGDAFDVGALDIDDDAPNQDNGIVDAVPSESLPPFLFSENEFEIAFKAYYYLVSLITERFHITVETLSAMVIAETQAQYNEFEANQARKRRMESVEWQR